MFEQIYSDLLIFFLGFKLIPQRELLFRGRPGTSVPGGFTREQYENLIERIPVGTPVNTETIVPRSENATGFGNSGSLYRKNSTLII
jgi:hypothetical protein